MKIKLGWLWAALAVAVGAGACMDLEATTTGTDCKAEAACYTGPSGTLEKGLCKGGSQVCSEGSAAGACVGEVVPVVEDCDTPEDEDCDGRGDCPIPQTTGVGTYNSELDDAVFAVATSGARIAAIGVGDGELDGASVKTGNVRTYRDDGMGSTGSYGWFPSLGYAAGRGITIDSVGTTVSIGDFTGSLDLQDGLLESAGGTDVFLVQLKTDGTGWRKRYGDTKDQKASDVVFDATGHVIVTGSFEGILDFGCGAMTASGQDGFLAKIAPTGDCVWSKQFGGPGAQTGFGVDTTSAGDIVVVGTIEGATDLFGDPVSSLGTRDAFAVMLSPAGETLWARSIGTTGSQDAVFVDVGPKGEIAIGGRFSGEMKVDDFAFKSVGADMYVIELEADGKVRWAQQFGGAWNEGATGVAVDAEGNVAVVGDYDGTFTLGPLVFTNAGALDMFVTKLRSADGFVVGGVSFGDELDQRAWGVDVDSTGRILVATATQGVVTVGGFTWTSQGGYDPLLITVTP